ncbi:hypothetical protein LINPERPRIM_LOCUS37106, partial [Linum perenne]
SSSQLHINSSSLLTLFRLYGLSLLAENSSTGPVTTERHTRVCFFENNRNNAQQFSSLKFGTGTSVAAEQE